LSAHTGEVPGNKILIGNRVVRIPPSDLSKLGATSERVTSAVKTPSGLDENIAPEVARVLEVEWFHNEMFWEGECKRAHHGYAHHRRPSMRVFVGIWVSVSPRREQAIKFHGKKILKKG